MIVDLHCHSIHSDGTWTVEALLHEAQARGFSGLSITDHDTLAGSFAAEPLLTHFTGTFFPGTELSVDVMGNRLHLLAHFPSFHVLHDSSFVNALNVMHENRWERMKKMIELAKKNEFPVSMNDVINEARGGRSGNIKPLLARPHLARVLVKKGVVATVDEAFKRYLDKGKILYVPKKTFSLREWVKFIKESHGILTWAHPFYNLNNDFSLLEQLLETLLHMGLDGIELYYNYDKYPIDPNFKKKADEYLFAISRENHLVITVGGDFHGDSGVFGGIPYPTQEWERFKNKIQTNEKPP